MAAERRDNEINRKERMALYRALRQGMPPPAELTRFDLNGLNNPLPIADERRRWSGFASDQAATPDVKPVGTE